MDHLENAQSLMRDFAERTGLAGDTDAPRRYLWTDAFAVCNYLGLLQRTGDQAYLALAVKLVDQVHAVLGRHRSDSVHSGWLSGLPEEEAKLHPTCAGLRIGKPMDERSADAPQDEKLEWSQDGQYFHYLTRWMHALVCVGRQTRGELYNQWASELARAAHRAFVYSPAHGGPKQMYWKMSIDLSRPQVPSMGHHDPLDGLVTCLQIEAANRRLAANPDIAEAVLSLRTEIEDFSAMCAGRPWATTDELGIGSLLCSACYVAQLVAEHLVADNGLLEVLLSDCLASLRSFAAQNRLHYPAEYRLGFRELGLATGLQAVARIDECLKGNSQAFTNLRRVTATVAELQGFCRLQEMITDFWLTPSHRAVASWRDHEDINSVMLATSLVPEGYLRA